MAAPTNHVDAMTAGGVAVQLATLCYVKQDGKTLMIRRHDGKWNGLGGKMHLGETPEECVIREVREESGLAIKNPLLRGLLTFPAFKDEEDWYVYVFTAYEFSGDLVDSKEGSLKWVDDTRLLELTLWEGDPIFLKCLDEGHFFSGKFIYKNGKLAEHYIRIHDWQMLDHRNVDERFRKGVRLFNEQEFSECHEVVEDLWRRTKGPYRDFYKGVIQAAVALHHLRQGRWAGAVKLFQSSTKYLLKYERVALGLNVEKLISDMKICFNTFDGWNGKKKLNVTQLRFPILEFEQKEVSSHGIS